jgi:Carboxypeptidase regulatory-like domain
LKPSGEVLAGVTIVLSGSQIEATTSGTDGAYSFTVNAGGNYTLAASKANYALSPQSQTFNDLGADQTADFMVTPLLLAVGNSTRAIALEPVTFLAEPFSPTRSLFYGGDNRTRVMLFATELGLLPGEGAAAVTAEAEDATHTRYPLTVEYVGSVPGFALMTAIVVRLNDNLGDVGDVLVRVTAHGMRSNRVRVGIGHIGGGPPDDPQTALRP